MSHLFRTLFYPVANPFRILNHYFPKPKILVLPDAVLKKASISLGLWDRVEVSKIYVRGYPATGLSIRLLAQGVLGDPVSGTKTALAVINTVYWSHRRRDIADYLSSHKLYSPSINVMTSILVSLKPEKILELWKTIREDYGVEARIGVWTLREYLGLTEKEWKQLRDHYNIPPPQTLQYTSISQVPPPTPAQKQLSQVMIQRSMVTAQQILHLIQQNMNNQFLGTHLTQSQAQSLVQSTLQKLLKQQTPSQSPLTQAKTPTTPSFTTQPTGKTTAMTTYPGQSPQTISQTYMVGRQLYYTTSSILNISENTRRLLTEAVLDATRVREQLQETMPPHQGTRSQGLTGEAYGLYSIDLGELADIDILGLGVVLGRLVASDTKSAVIRILRARSFTRRSPRVTHVHLPARIRRYGDRPIAIIGIDVSGSISKVELKRFIKTIKEELLDQRYVSRHSLVVYWDTRIERVNTLEKEAKNPEPPYGGGTTPEVFFTLLDALLTNRKPRDILDQLPPETRHILRSRGFNPRNTVVILLTDGEFLVHEDLFKAFTETARKTLLAVAGITSNVKTAEKLREAKWKIRYVKTKP